MMESDPTFRIFSDEIKRQYDLQFKVGESHDSKLGILLGFIIVIITQIIFYKDFTNLIVSSKIFLYGFSVIYFSGVLGAVTYITRRFPGGPEILGLLKQYERGEKRDFDKVISRKIFDSDQEISEINKIKSMIINIMIFCFFLGILFIMISRVYLV